MMCAAVVDTAALWISVAAIFAALFFGASVFLFRKSREAAAYKAILDAVKKQLAEAVGGVYVRRPQSAAYGDLNAFTDYLNTLSEDVSGRINQLNSEKNTLNTVLSNMRQGIVSVNTDRNAILINSAAEDIFKCKNVQGKNILFATQDEKLLKAVNEALDKNSSALFELQSDGKFFSASVTPYEDYGGARRALVILDDITIQRSLEKMRSDFFSNASHELKTPLSAIKGFSELIEISLDPTLTAKYNKYIVENTSRMMCLLDDMLYLSKIDARVDDEKEEVDLNKLAEDCLTTLQSEIREKGITAEVEGEACIFASKEKMTQILINLLSNAVRYNKQDGRVRVILEEGVSRVTITVQDTGIGIDGEHIGRIFERFYRVDKSRSKKLGGTGLGLAIVKNISHLYNGEISVKSVKGEGSRFKVVLSKVSDQSKT